MGSESLFRDRNIADARRDAGLREFIGTGCPVVLPGARAR